MRVPRQIAEFFSWFRDHRLKTEVAAHLPALPVLRDQLRNSASQIETAVVSVCENFQGIATRARDAVSRASRFIGQSGDSNEPAQVTIDALIADFQVTVGHLLERMERGNDVSVRAIDRMCQVSQATAGITKVLHRVDQLAFENRLLALNAKIQAVHVGDAGAGFGVVADEIANQAGKSNELTGEIGSMLKAVSAAVDAVSRDLRELASEDNTRLTASREEVAAAIEKLRTVHENMRESLAAMAVSGEELANDVAKAVIAMQFQDRVCQQISHVVGALESMEAALTARSSAISSHGFRSDDVLARLGKSYTMESERAVLAKVAQRPAGPSVAGGEVELF